MNTIGVMNMPVDFPYREVFLKGKPQHEKYDPFRRRHPTMDLSRRAKIFSPFDALKGFDEAISSKDVRYRDQIVLSEDDREELNRRLRILKELTFNSRMARKNHVIITVMYYVPCADENNESFGLRGSYKEITGVCSGVDEIRSVLSVDRLEICFDDIFRIENDADIFKRDWDSYYPEG